MIEELRRGLREFFTSSPFHAFNLGAPEVQKFLTGISEAFRELSLTDIRAETERQVRRVKRLVVQFGPVIIAHPGWRALEDLTRLPRAQELLSYQHRQLTYSEIVTQGTAGYGEVHAYAQTVPEFYEVWHERFGRIERDYE